MTATCKYYNPNPKTRLLVLSKQAYLDDEKWNEHLIHKDLFISSQFLVEYYRNGLFQIY
jgi:hypothetical protein